MDAKLQYIFKCFLKLKNREKFWFEYFYVANMTFIYAFGKFGDLVNRLSKEDL